MLQLQLLLEGCDGLVPFTVEPLHGEVDLSHLLVAYFLSGGIDGVINFSNPQSEFQLELRPVDLNRVPPILLQTFFVVAEVGQISEAARRLHLSQPAVTGHIRRLEANLETTLFIRSARGVTLTPLGARLRERLHHVFTELEQVLGELDLSREETGIVTLAASTTLARYFVPRIFLRFHQYHPAAALNLIMGFFSCWEIQHEIAMGLIRPIDIPGLRIRRMFSWALPSGELARRPCRRVLSICQFDPKRAIRD